MAKYIISKSKPLSGKVRISGSKNAVLPILAASLLADGESIIEDIPRLSDVLIMQELLQSLGANVEYKDNNMKISIKVRLSSVAEYELVQKMRASFLIIGPILARTGYAKISLPGGCAIGNRPVDLHLKGLEALGASINQEHGYVEVRASKLIGTKIYLDFPSVGATETIIMVASLAEGQTILENAASEPEIVDLANYLNSMGADIIGAGTDSIKINGVKSLIGTTHTIIPDRIEAGTYMVAAAITKGDVYIDNVLPDHIKPVIAKLREININVEEIENGIHVIANDIFNPVDIKTLPYPGFPTDMQAQFMSLLSICKGTSIVRETIFENRFMHVGELKRMGADIKIEGRSAIINGVNCLTGTKVKATDLRAGASLVLVSLVAEGNTEISDIYHLERGYEDIEKKLNSLGANIKRLE